MPRFYKGNIFQNSSVKKFHLLFQEVKIIQFLEVYLDTAFVTLKLKYKQISTVILQPQGNNGSTFINHTLKFRRRNSRHIQPISPKTYIQVYYISFKEHKLQKMLESFAETIPCCAENV